MVMVRVRARVRVRVRVRIRIKAVTTSLSSHSFSLPGAECDFVVLSFVRGRNSGSVGFLKDSRPHPGSAPTSLPHNATAQLPTQHTTLVK